MKSCWTKLFYLCICVFMFDCLFYMFCVNNTLKFLSFKYMLFFNLNIVEVKRVRLAACNNVITTDDILQRIKDYETGVEIMVQQGAAAEEELDGEDAEQLGGEAACPFPNSLQRSSASTCTVPYKGRRVLEKSPPQKHLSGIPLSMVDPESGSIIVTSENGSPGSTHEAERDEAYEKDCVGGHRGEF